jgi:lipid II:glycine glycyltransferase (peptidoglycan interpeptide bridge formation enzyme)
MRFLTSTATTKLDALDASVWDRFVAQDPQGHLLQTWAWGELKGRFGWAPVRIAVERDGALMAGAQVLFRRLGPLTLAYAPKGPVLLDDDPAVAGALWQGLRRLARPRRAVALKLEPDWRDEESERHAWLHRCGFAPSAQTVQPRRTIIVDLAGGEDDILARMKPKWRYNVRLAERKGVAVAAGGAAEVMAFHALMQVTGERDAFGVHSAAYYRAVLELFAPLGQACLLTASYEGQPLAGLVAMQFRGRAYYMYGASSNEQRNLMPNHLLQWRAMQWARAAGCRSYDLWGIPDVHENPETAPLAGVQRFKAGFGGEEVRFVGAYDQVYRPLLNRGVELAWRLRSRGALAGAPLGG